MSERYIVQEGSNSGHCCFDFSVMDTARLVKIDGKPIGPKAFEAVCECFERADADLICAALNAAKP